MPATPTQPTPPCTPSGRALTERQARALGCVLAHGEATPAMVARLIQPGAVNQFGRPTAYARQMGLRALEELAARGLARRVRDEPPTFAATDEGRAAAGH